MPLLVLTLAGIEQQIALSKVHDTKQEDTKNHENYHLKERQLLLQ